MWFWMRLKRGPGGKDELLHFNQDLAKWLSQYTRKLEKAVDFREIDLDLVPNVNFDQESSTGMSLGVPLEPG
jgi:hypothetical protein